MDALITMGTYEQMAAIIFTDITNMLCITRKMSHALPTLDMAKIQMNKHVENYRDYG